MTSLAMALGSLPLALSLGASSSSRVPLGLVIVGGVIFSLGLTLFVVPAVYTYLSRDNNRSASQNHFGDLAASRNKNLTDDILNAETKREKSSAFIKI
jgi:multidrug efflux pump